MFRAAFCVGGSRVGLSAQGVDQAFANAGRGCKIP
jgi:hypothetical protein